MIKCEEKGNEENLGETRYVDEMSTHARCTTSYNRFLLHILEAIVPVSTSQLIVS
jgi:hypothetical protein